MTARYRIKAFVSADGFEENAYVLSSGNESVIIDPGGSAEQIAAYIDAENLHVTVVLATHGHIDHVAAASQLSHRFRAPFYIDSHDSPLLSDLKEQAIAFGYGSMPDVAPDGFFDEGRLFQLGQVSLAVLHTPGHSPGSSCFLVDGESLFTGDTLFAGSIGRTDLPGGSLQEMESSLRKIAALEDDVNIYPGHGGSSTIGYEKSHNPFLLSAL